MVCFLIFKKHLLEMIGGCVLLDTEVWKGDQSFFKRKAPC